MSCLINFLCILLFSYRMHDERGVPFTCDQWLQVGIPIFVTGGSGGVHRHGEQSNTWTYLNRYSFDTILNAYVPASLLTFLLNACLFVYVKNS